MPTQIIKYLITVFLCLLLSDLDRIFMHSLRPGQSIRKLHCEKHKKIKLYCGYEIQKNVLNAVDHFPLLAACAFTVAVSATSAADHVQRHFG